MSKFFHEAFLQNNHRCAYCGRDLLADFDSFMLAQEDHIVPLSAGGSDTQDNIVVACATCNLLKGGYVPTGMDVSNRDLLMSVIRAHIFAERAKHMQDFASWAFSR